MISWKQCNKKSNLEVNKLIIFFGIIPSQARNVNLIVCQATSNFRVKWDWRRLMKVHCLFSWLVALNKMGCHFWHQFLTQFSLLFQMVPFILLCVVAYSTIAWLVDTIPTANQRALCWWFLKLPWRENIKAPSERALKTK